MGTRVLLDQFADGVIRLTNEWFPGCPVVDYVDPTGSYMSDKTQETSFSILRKKDIIPRFRRVPVMKGIEIIQRNLLTLIGDKPTLLVHRDNNLGIDMFEGGYYFAKDSEGNVDEKDPAKDGYFEHVSDSYRYIIVNLLAFERNAVREHVPMKQLNWSSSVLKNVSTPVTTYGREY
jgi:hypothetical protein